MFTNKLDVRKNLTKEISLHVYSIQFSLPDSGLLSRFSLQDDLPKSNIDTYSTVHHKNAAELYVDRVVTISKPTRTKKKTSKKPVTKLNKGPSRNAGIKKRVPTRLKSRAAKPKQSGMDAFLTGESPKKIPNIARTSTKSRVATKKSPAKEVVKKTNKSTKKEKDALKDSLYFGSDEESSDVEEIVIDEQVPFANLQSEESDEEEKPSTPVKEGGMLKFVTIDEDGSDNFVQKKSPKKKELKEIPKKKTTSKQKMTVFNFEDDSSESPVKKKGTKRKRITSPPKKVKKIKRRKKDGSSHKQQSIMSFISPEFEG
eukprot:TRINITY_DN2331_c0_g1_i2.p1 TRINITY_DN2331_c0_g1~~TRINITY_DN2331_c0_g1_i2.p1  ORF type:complete len:314 (+),score=71.47 TRINITY_DN2331_c0_g1_i2:338-1279(+)